MAKHRHTLEPSEQVALSDILQAALAADQAYSEALRRNGYKTRWCKHQGNAEVMQAYHIKVAADQALHDFWQSRT